MGPRWHVCGNVGSKGASGDGLALHRCNNRNVQRFSDGQKTASLMSVFSLDGLAQDVVAGLTLAATSVPQAVAYAELSGVAGWRGLAQRRMAVYISVEL